MVAAVAGAGIAAMQLEHVVEGDVAAIEVMVNTARIAELTPPNAVIASSLNSGALDLHSQRLAFRPSGWTGDQLLKFVRALHKLVREHTQPITHDVKCQSSRASALPRV